MSNPTISQSQKRTLESLASVFTPISELSDSSPYVFLKSSTDTGVILNGGRNGARFAPQSFMSVFKKMTKHESFKMASMIEVEVGHEELETFNFPNSQTKEAAAIAGYLERFPNSSFCHLGGGHDHIYPYLTALGKTYKKIVVLNLDAHADTRTDEIPSSGTPFRQFSREFSGDFQLFQLGLHPFANSSSTLSALPKGHMTILWRQDWEDQKKKQHFFEAIKAQLVPNTAFVFSLDVDVISAHDAPGVSAVNGHGLTRQEVTEIWQFYNNLNTGRSFTGIYEMNPVYDSLAMTTVRTIATLFFENF